MKCEERESLGIRASRAQIRNLLRVARERDLNRGGYYDGRSGCVNCWCGPDDKPACWDQPISKGALDYPREYVGDLDWEWQADDSAIFHIEAAPYGLLGEATPRRRELPEEAWRELMRWLREKAWRLIAAAASLPDVIGIRCPFCPFILPEGELLNGLVYHIGEAHPGHRITGLLMGTETRLRTAGDTYPLVEATEGER